MNTTTKFLKDFCYAIGLILSIAWLLGLTEGCRKTTSALAEETHSKRVITITDLENACSVLSKKIYELPPGALVVTEGGLTTVGTSDSIQGIATYAHKSRSFTDSIWFAWNHKVPDYIEFSQFLDTTLVVSFKKDQDTYLVIGDTAVLFERIDALTESIEP